MRMFASERERENVCERERKRNYLIYQLTMAYFRRRTISLSLSLSLSLTHIEQACNSSSNNKNLKYNLSISTLHCLFLFMVAAASRQVGSQVQVYTQCRLCCSSLILLHQPMLMPTSSSSFYSGRLNRRSGSSDGNSVGDKIQTKRFSVQNVKRKNGNVGLSGRFNRQIQCRYDLENIEVIPITAKYTYMTIAGQIN